MEKRVYQLSNTTLEAKWEQDKIFGKLWYCGNCHKGIDTVETRELTHYCSRCGARVTNPQYIKIEYDYDF